MNRREVKRAPVLRFKGFTNDWEQHTLGDFGSVAMNKRIFKNQTTDKGDVPFFKISTFGKKADSFISNNLFEKYKEKYPYPQKGDLLISASGSIGRIVEYKGQKAYYQDSNIVWLNHNKELLNIYLKAYYQIIHWHGIEGSTIKRLYNKNILATSIFVPDKKEQYELGKLIKKAEKIISLQQRKLKLLKVMKKALSQYMFCQEIEFVPILRFNSFSDKWKYERLKNLIVKEIKGKAKADMKGTKSTYIDTALLNGGSITKVDSPTDTFHNDIIILWDGSQAGKIYHGFTGALGSTLKSYKPKYSGGFLYQYLKSKEPIIFLRYRTPNIPHVVKDFTEIFKINVPSVKEQEKISKTLNYLDQSILVETKKIGSIKKIKKFLLQNMFI